VAFTAGLKACATQPHNKRALHNLAGQRLAVFVYNARLMNTLNDQAAWRARGLLFENCNCQLVCPGHMHFSQLCTHERCKGYWAIRFDEGDFGGASLAGVKAVIVYDTPRHMIDGDWTEGLIIDQAASAEQRQAIEAILSGRAGGPWEKLAQFVGRWLETKFVPIVIVEESETKQVSIAGVLQAAIKNIRGRDRSRPVRFENSFNQIHATSQVLATGTTQYDDGEIVIRNEGTHGLYSSFEWSVAASR
jgi:hypothetical protein